MKKALSFILSLLLCLNCIMPVFVYANEVQPKLIFKYYDVDAERYLEDGECMYVDRIYELQLWIDDVTNLLATGTPIHYNKDVLQLITTDGTVVENDIMDSDEINGEHIIKYDEENWFYIEGGEGSENPRILVSKGFVQIDSLYSDYSRGITTEDESFLLAMKFKTVTSGNPDIRVSDRQKDPDCWDPSHLDGAGFSFKGGRWICPQIVNSSFSVSSRVTGVNIVEEKIEVGVDTAIQLNAVVSPSDAFDKSVIWSSNDDEIATVDENGNVTGVKEGTVTITVTTKDGGFIDTCEVTVINENRPTVPTGLRIVSKTGKTVTFSWNASTGKSGITGYNVYRDGEHIGTATECIFTDDDETLTQGKEYTYTVEAFYENQGDVLKSGKSGGLKVTLAAPEIISVTPESQSVLGATKQQTVYVYYKNDYNREGTTLTVEYKDGEEYKEVASENISGVVSGSNYTGNYFTFTMVPKEVSEADALNLRFTVTDASGLSDSEEVTYAVVKAPTPVVIEGEPQPNKIVLSWSKAQSAYVEKYIVYRKLSESDTWVRYKHINGKDTTYFIDDTAAENAKYDYYVTAVDRFNQESEDSNIIEQIMPGKDEEPPVVATISPSSESVLSKTATIKAVVEDSKGIEKVELQYRVNETDEWEVLEEMDNPASSTVSFSLDTTLISADRIYVRVMAWDVDGNESDGLPVRTYIIDNTPPKKVTNVKGNADSATKITLTWNEYKEDDDFYYFTVEQKNADGTYTQTGDKIYDVKGMVVKNLAPGTEYTFRVYAYDRAGNRSEPSEDCSVTTIADTSGPVITKITPEPKDSNQDINMTITAEDDYKVEYIKLQITNNEVVKYDEIILRSSAPSKSITERYTLKVSDYEDGKVSVCAIPYDVYGNEGTSTTYGYKINTAPPSPCQNLKATGKDGYIEVEWDKATEEDFAYYTIVRAESEAGPYTVVSAECTNKNFIDKNVDKNKTYYYKVSVTDRVGNTSAYEGPVSASLAPDKTAPVIDGLLPSDNARINNNSSITVYASDNYAVAKVVLEYFDGSNWKKADEGENEISSFTLETLNLPEGKYKFRAYAVDAGGNRSEYSDVYEYTLDNTAPVIKNVTAESGTECINLSFDCEPYEDLRGITVYYKSENSSYKTAATRAPSESNSYEVKIAGLSAQEKYTIKIVAADMAGNTAEYIIGQSAGGEIVVEPKPVEVVKPQIEISAPSTVVQNKENIFKAVKIKGTYDIKSYEWSFGDGKTSSLKETAHAFDSVGTYIVSCTVTDTKGNTYTANKKVTVTEEKSVATLSIKIVDDEGNRLPDVGVVFNVTGEQLHYKSNSSGICEITAAPGKYEVGFYKDGYLPAQKAVSLVKNATISLEVRLVKKNIVVGSLTWERMTLEEIKEAGIDTTNPANSNMFKYEMTVYIGEEEITFSGHKSIDDDAPIRVTDKDFTSENKLTDESGKLVNNTIYVYDFNDKENGYSYDADSDTHEAPRTLVAYVQTPGEISWLKEFFNVTLTVTNQAEERFWLTNCHALLNFPESGLTLMSDNADTSLGYEATAGGETFPNTIKGQQTAEAKWILRGDIAGEYNISADFGGKLGSVTNGEFDDWDTPIDITFESDRPIKVYGTEGLSVVVEYEDETDPVSDYMFRIGIRNRSVLTRYLPDVVIDENEFVKAVEGYHNYKELISGKRLPSEAETLEYGETVYSNFTVSGISEDDDIAGIIIKRLQESNVNLPVEYVKVRPLGFHERKIDLYTVDDEGHEIEADAHAMSAYPGTKIKFGIHLTELLPGSDDYVDCKNEKVYLDDEYIGKTNDNGILIYEYTVPEGKNISKKLTFKGNRTVEDNVFVQILDDTVVIKGHVHDMYGNPIKKAIVTVDGRSLETEKDGSFEFEAMKSGKRTINVTKEKYRSITETLNLVPGEKNLIYNLERIVSKPKIQRAYFGTIANWNKKIIVPEGLKIKDNIMFWANCRLDDEAVTYKADAVDSSGEVRPLTIGGEYKTEFDLSQLKAGDTLRVYILNDGTPSDPYVMPVEVSKAPFVNLLNSISSGVNSGIMSSRISFASLFDEINGKTWLEGEALTKWNDIFDKFRSSFSINVEGYNLESDTELIIDWFKYKNFTVCVNYDLFTGKFSVLPQSMGSKYNVDTYEGTYNSMVVTESSENGNRTGSFSIEEVIDEDVRKATGYRYSSLYALNTLSWDLESMFKVQFTYDRNSWNGEFELSVDEDNRFYGYYARELPDWEKIGPWDFPENLAGSWFKSMTASDDIKIPLNSAATNGEFTLNYNSNTNGGWYTGLGNIVLSSVANNTITLYPEPKLQGVTSLSGGYYILGYCYNLFANENVMSSYTIYRNEDMAKSLSLLRNGFMPADTMLEPVSLLSVRSNETAPDALENGVFPNAEIGIAEADKPYMVYLQQNTSRENPAERSQVVIRESSSDGWKDAYVIEDDETGDYNPSVASVGDKALVVWADSSTKLPLSGNLSVADIQSGIASKLGISAAVYDGKSDNKVSGIVKLNTKECLNYSPVVSSFNDGAVAVWIENEDNMMTEQDRQDSLVFSVLSGEEWSEAQYLSDAVNRRGSISDLEIAEENGIVYLTFAVTELREYVKDSKDENASEEAETSEEKLKKFYMLSYNGKEWSTVKILNDSAIPDEFASFIRVHDELQLLTISGNIMYRYIAATREIVEKTTIDDSLAAASEFTTAYNSENAALLWVASENEEDSTVGQKIYSSLYEKDKDSWSGAVEAKAIENKYVAKNLNAAFSEGVLEFAYNLYEYNKENGELKNVSLSSAQQNLDYDIELTAISLKDNTVMSGNDAKFNVEVKNKGLKDALDFSITVTSSTGESFTKNGLSLEGGKSDEIEVAFNIGEVTDNITVTAVAASDKDTNSSNNQKECDVVVANTEINDISCTPSDENTLLVNVEIKNTGMVDVSRKIKLYNAETDAVIDEKDVSVKIGERTAVVFETENPDSEITLKAEIVLSDVKEISDENKEKELVYTPNSKYAFGVIKPIAGKDELVLKNSAEVSAIEDGETQVEVTLENNEFKMMIPKESDLEVSAPGMIPRPVTTVPQNGETVELFVGDVIKNERNVIDIVDLSAIVSMLGYNENITQSSERVNKVLNILGDVNKDGEVNGEDLLVFDFVNIGNESGRAITIADLTTVISNFGKAQEDYVALEEKK